MLTHQPRVKSKFRIFSMKGSQLEKDVKTGQANLSRRKFEFYSDVETEKVEFIFFCRFYGPLSEDGGTQPASGERCSRWIDRQFEFKKFLNTDWFKIIGISTNGFLTKLVEPNFEWVQVDRIFFKCRKFSIADFISK